MSKSKIPIDDSHMKIQQCTAEKQRLLAEVQAILGDDIPLPKCADVKLLADGSIIARSMSENGTVHSVDIYTDGYMSRVIYCSDGDLFIDTLDGEKQVCKNFATVPEIPHSISDAKLRKARELLLNAGAVAK